MTASRERWVHEYRKRRFQVLFLLLLAALVATPLLHALGLRGYTLQACLLAGLLSAGLGGLGLGRGIGIAVLIALFLASRLIHWSVGGGEAFATAGDVFLALAAVLAGVAALRVVLRSGAVTSERLYAASSVYLLAGLAFALAYHGLSRIDPGSFVVLGEARALDAETAVYFSFVTLATLGYGDVVPAAPFARSLAICEAVGAQLFVAVLIARLVSLQSRARE